MIYYVVLMHTCKHRQSIVDDLTFPVIVLDLVSYSYEQDIFFVFY